MGALAIVNCECGFSTQVLLGSLKSNFKTVCWFQVYCRGCKTLQIANLFEPPLACPGCNGADVEVYDSPELIGEDGERDVFSRHTEVRLGRVLRLSNGQ